MANLDIQKSNLFRTLFFFSPHRMHLFILMFLLPNPTLSLNTTVCDCSQAKQKGFLKFIDEDCNLDTHPSPPTPVKYNIISTLPMVKRFPGYTCTMWSITKTVYTNALWWTTVSQTRLPMEVTAAECRKIRDLRQCRGQNMDALGSNKWSLEVNPHVQGSWLRTISISTVNCRLEEVALESECTNCTISSPLGDIPGTSNGSISHNLVTLVWEDSWKEQQECQLKALEGGNALLYETTDPFTQRIRDSEKQLDFLFNKTKIRVCNIPQSRSPYMQILGMNKVVIQILPPTTQVKQPPSSDHLTKILKSEIDLAAHTQYVRDIAVEMSNTLAKELRTAQCQTRKLAHQNAVATAQFNGWLAASYLELPTCSKLTTVGNSVSVLQCTPINVTFETTLTRCGPQPHFNKQTINVEGWELTKFSECYWHSNFVNFNGHAHTYRNGSWTKINPSIIIQGNERRYPPPHAPRH